MHGQDVEQLSRCMDNALEITYRTFQQKIGTEEINRINNALGYYTLKDAARSLKLHNDYAVCFYRGKFHNKTCYIMDHSSIWYVYAQTE